MKKKALLAVLTCFVMVSGIYAQKVGAKTNFAWWGIAGSPNLQLELKTGAKSTLELGAGFNPFTFSDNKKAKHWLAQPEIRYWFCEPFNGSFFGFHLLGGQMNVGGWDINVGRLSKFKDHRYQGWFYGAGVSYGYQWILSPRWNFELNLGGGYARLEYDKFPCAKCGVKEDSGNYNYFGVTKAAISLVYMIK
ncbi:MAG: DUF3575 domain-containing protein [Fermentimonas sp.]|jgi:hypothetical protein